jgi:peptidyl-tRNA hydrolase, PTH1 family
VKRAQRLKRALQKLKWIAKLNPFQRRTRLETMSEQRLSLVAGLGNPGPKYDHTRHNVGFMVIDALAAQYHIAVDRQKFNVLLGRGRIGDTEVVLAKPQGFMNRSGPPLRQLTDYFRIQSETMVIVHDDIDLAFDRLKIKEKGGDGGHKGIRSTIEAFGAGQFARLRVGVGRSEFGKDAADHVLSNFSPDEQAALGPLLQKATEAVVTILSKGTREAMNQFN